MLGHSDKVCRKKGGTSKEWRKVQRAETQPPLPSAQQETQTETHESGNTVQVQAQQPTSEFTPVPKRLSTRTEQPWKDHAPSSSNAFQALSEHDIRQVLDQREVPPHG